MPSNIMEISVAQQARDIQRMARRNIKSEYKQPDPSLRRALGHYAVYHYASNLVQYEDVFESSDDEHTQEDEGMNEALYEAYSILDSEEAENQEIEDEKEKLWQGTCSEEVGHYAPPAYTEIDALRWLLPTDDQTLEYEDMEPEMEMPLYEPPVFDDVSQSPKDSPFNPLRQHPPTSSTLNKDTMSEWQSKIFTTPQVEIRRRVVAFQLAEVLLRALKKLGIKKSKGSDEDEGPDIEAQIDLQHLAAAIVSETGGQTLFAPRTACVI